MVLQSSEFLQIFIWYAEGCRALISAKIMGGHQMNISRGRFSCWNEKVIKLV